MAGVDNHLHIPTCHHKSLRQWLRLLHLIFIPLQSEIHKLKRRESLKTWKIIVNWQENVIGANEQPEDDVVNWFKWIICCCWYNNVREELFGKDSSTWERCSWKSFSFNFMSLFILFCFLSYCFVVIFCFIVNTSWLHWLIHLHWSKISLIATVVYDQNESYLLT